jgi:hypothetical protein
MEVQVDRLEENQSLLAYQLNAGHRQNQTFFLRSLLEIKKINYFLDSQCNRSISYMNILSDE